MLCSSYMHYSCMLTLNTSGLYKSSLTASAPFRESVVDSFTASWLTENQLHMYFTCSQRNGTSL